MTIAEIIETSQGQTIRLPDEFRFATRAVSIRREGDAVVLEPLKPANWPEGFFEAIRIDDPAFTRPEPGPIPPAPTFNWGRMAGGDALPARHEHLHRSDAKPPVGCPAHGGDAPGGLRDLDHHEFGGLANNSQAQLYLLPSHKPLA